MQFWKKKAKYSAGFYGSDALFQTRIGRWYYAFHLKDRQLSDDYKALILWTCARGISKDNWTLDLNFWNRKIKIKIMKTYLKPCNLFWRSTSLNQVKNYDKVQGVIQACAINLFLLTIRLVQSPAVTPLRKIPNRVDSDYFNAPL